MTGCKRKNADFSSAVLDGTNFSGADLRAAQFAGAEFIDANLRGAKLADANLRGAAFHGDTLKEIDLSLAQTSKRVRLDKEELGQRLAEHTTWIESGGQ